MERATRKNRFVALFMMIALMFSFVAPLSQPAAAQSQADADQLFFCDYRNQGKHPLTDTDPVNYPKINGSVADWWTKYAPAGGVDCIDLAVDNTSVCGQINATFFSYVTLKDGGKVDRLTWYELSDSGNVVTYGTDFPKSFPEDYSDGAVQVLINFNSPESDILIGMSDYDRSHWRTTSRGVEYTVVTDCEREVVYGCSQGYFKNNGYGANTTLDNAGLVTPYDGSTTLLEVLSNPGSGKIQRGVQTYDGYTRQQVTAYLNHLQFGLDYPLTLADIQAGDVSMADLEYYNHGGEDVTCP